MVVLGHHTGLRLHLKSIPSRVFLHKIFHKSSEQRLLYLVSINQQKLFLIISQIHRKTPGMEAFI